MTCTRLDVWSLFILTIMHSKHKCAKQKSQFRAIVILRELCREDVLAALLSIRNLSVYSDGAETASSIGMS